MNIIQKLQIRIDQMTGTPGDGAGRWTRLIFFQIRLWQFCLQRLRANNAMAMSAALSFRTIFALVPTLVLILLIVKSLGVIQDSKADLQQLLNVGGLNIAINYDSDEAATKSATPTEPAENGSAIENPSDNKTGSTDGETAGKPGKQINVADTIHSLVGKLETQLTFGRIGPVGVALLIWTAITLLSTIERSLNRIYGVEKGRSLTRQIMMYWTILTLGPIILIVVKYLGMRAMTASAKIPVLSWTLLSFGWAMPIIVGIVLLALLYKLLPNTRVSFLWALAGAMVAVPCWVAAKWLFGLYVTEVARKSLYGAMGLLPIFLMWMNLSWWIFLFGAELSQILANFRRMESARQSEKITLGPLDTLAAAMAIAVSHQAGQGPMPFDRLTAMLNLPAQALQRIIDRLMDRGLICPVENDQGTCYTLAKPAGQIPILNVCSLDGQAESARTGQYDESIGRRIAAVQSQARDAIGKLSLGDAAKIQ